MMEDQKLYPIELPLERFLAITAGLFWLAYLVPTILGGCLQDPIIKVCIISGSQYILMIGLMSWFYRSEKWPSVNPVKIHPISCFAVGSIGEIQLFPFLIVIGLLWHKILSIFECIWNIDLITEQPLLSMHSEFTHQSQFWSILLLVTIFAPIAEEIIFRYFLYRYCKFYMSPPKAMLLTSLIFALLHLNLAVFAPLFVMGVFLTFLYERHGNLIPCIILHGIHNYLTIMGVILFSKISI